MDEKFDCIIVGGGIAGLSTAMVLARAGTRFLLVERGEFCGAKNVSGGILWGTDLAKLVPDYWQQDHGFERFVNHRRLSFLDEQSATSIDFKSSHFNEAPYHGVSVLRAKFDSWLARKVQETIDANEMSGESFLATNILVEELLVDRGKVCGIKTGDEKFYAECVVLAEGVNNLLTRTLNLVEDQAEDPAEAKYVALGVKEVIQFEQSVLEDRFQLTSQSGMANEFLGYASQGVSGGGFLYTNRDSVSIGLVLELDDMRNDGRKPYDLLNSFKAHPSVADMIRGGKVIEYSAHVVSNGNIRGMPSKVYGDGVLLAGESAHLLMNSGRAIQGMDFAMRSGILAADTVLEAKQSGDYSANVLKSYHKRLDESFVLKDMHAYQGAVRLLHDPLLSEKMPEMLCDFGRRFFTIDNEPTEKVSAIMKGCIRDHSSYWELSKLAFQAYRSL